MRKGWEEGVGGVNATRFRFSGDGLALDDANDEKRRGIVALRKILKKISKNRGR